MKCKQPRAPCSLTALHGMQIIGRSKGKKTVVGRDYIVQRHTLRGVTYPQVFVTYPQVFV